MKKLLAILLLVAFACGALVSCSPVQMLERASRALEEAPYKVTMKMGFECDDREYNEIFSMMDFELPMIVDGENMEITMDMVVMGYSADITMTLVDRVLYYSMSIMGEKVKAKTELSSEDLADFLEDNKNDILSNPEKFFTNLSVESKDGKNYITCEGISPEGLEELDETVGDTLESLDDANASVDNVKCLIIISDGKYEEINLTCDYTIEANGKTVNQSIKLSSKKNNVFNIEI